MTYFETTQNTESNNHHHKIHYKIKTTQLQNTESSNHHHKHLDKLQIASQLYDENVEINCVKERVQF
jgi:hypothetical protein